MPRVIKLGAVSPNHLNLNGDLGNLLVLQKRLEWRNVESSISHLTGFENFNEFDFILIGHGSSAAWSQLLNANAILLKNIAAYINDGGALLAVASAMDHLQPILTGVSIRTGAWVSEFVEIDSVVGYLNTTSKSEGVTWYRNALLTQLHGPVLAKNPSVADQIIQNNGWADINEITGQLTEVDDLAKRSRKIAFEH